MDATGGSGRGPALRLLASVFLAGAVVVGCAPSSPTPGIPGAGPIDTVKPAATTPVPTVGPPPSSAGPIAGEPDPVMTPGATNPAVTQASIGSTICVSGWTATVRPPVAYTTALKLRQIAAYGYSDTTLADYEEDHLISLEIGGAPKDPLNLWPEPYTVSLPDGTPVGARVKDQLENYLHKQVCGGQVTLNAAQALIAGDWEGAWRAAGLDTGPGASPAPTEGQPASSAPSAAPSAALLGGLRVRLVDLTSPVTRGDAATIDVQTLAGASCSITVRYKSGPSKASGLTRATADDTGAVGWTWTVGSRTTPGTWPITVTCRCGSATASLAVTFTVR